MPEVPEHLVPADGLTNSRIRLGGLDTHQVNAGVTLRYDIYDEEDDYVGTLKFAVGPTTKGTIDAMVVAGYAHLTKVLRQWLYEADKTRTAYENKVAP